MVEAVAGGSGRYYQDGGADGPFKAVGGTVYYRNFICALLLGGKGGRTAAVEIYGDYAPRLVHDLRYLSCAAACGEGLLAAVKRHEYDPVVRGDADAGSGGSGIIVVIAVGNHDLTVANEEDTAADRFNYAIRIFLPLRSAADDGSAVIEDSEEVFVSDAVVLYAVHHECACRGGVGHVIEVRIDAHDSVIVLNIVGGVVGVGMLFLSSRHLVGHSGETPARCVVKTVVRIDIEVVPSDIDTADVINYLLVVSCRCAPYLLRDARSNGGAYGRENGIIIVALFADEILCKLIEIIRKHVAAGISQIAVLGEAAFAFEKLSSGIAPVCLVNGTADLALGVDAGEPVGEEEGRSEAVGKHAPEIVLHYRGQALSACTDAAHDVESVEVAVDVIITERMSFVIIDAEVILGDFGGHLFNAGSCKSAVLGVLHKVADIACPAAEILRGNDAGIIVGDVERAEHMRKFHRLTVGNGKASDASQIGCRGAVLHVLFGNIVDKCGVLGACKYSPAPGVVLFNARADIVDYQSDRAFTGHGSIFARIAFEYLKVRKECVELLAGFDIAFCNENIRIGHGFCKVQHGRKRQHEREQKRNRLNKSVLIHFSPPVYLSLFNLSIR